MKWAWTLVHAESCLAIHSSLKPKKQKKPSSQLQQGFAFWGLTWTPNHQTDTTQPFLIELFLPTHCQHFHVAISTFFNLSKLYFLNKSEITLHYIKTKLWYAAVKAVNKKFKMWSFTHALLSHILSMQYQLKPVLQNITLLTIWYHLLTILYWFSYAHTQRLHTHHMRKQEPAVRAEIWLLPVEWEQTSWASVLPGKKQWWLSFCFTSFTECFFTQHHSPQLPATFSLCVMYMSGLKHSCSQIYIILSKPVHCSWLCNWTGVPNHTIPTLCIEHFKITTIEHKMLYREPKWNQTHMKVEKEDKTN